MVDLPDVFRQFEIAGSLTGVLPHGGGHINDTFLGEFEMGQSRRRCLLQRINHRVFRDPAQVMENIERVTRYARERIVSAGGDPLRETLTLIPTRSGSWFYCSPAGEYWRCYHFIDGARTQEGAEDLRLVQAAAAAFGRFLALMDQLPGPRLHETIANFHHTRQRLADFTSALQADRVNRAAEVQHEIDFIQARAQQASVVVDLLSRGVLPERITHNDTKLNNVLIDDSSGRGICVIDLDTVMPGSVLYDFGDLIRMGASCAAEDEPDLSKVGLDLQRFAALASGYLAEAGRLLVPAEWELLAFAGRLITYEQAMRFLGDFLNGDTYYKIQRPNHNLDRARTQIKLVAEMEKHQGEMEAVVADLRQAGLR